jgi:hypothetical protein
MAGLRAGERLLPVLPALAELLPGGALRRGTVVGCCGCAATTLAVSMIVEASRQGSWVGIAGMTTLGVRMLDELGVDLGRVVQVGGPLDPGAWADAMVALIDGFDVVVADSALPLRTPAARKLQSRVQARGAVLVLAGGTGSFTVDVQLGSTQPRWVGLGDGHGIARARQVVVEVYGRRVARPQEMLMWLPADDGSVEHVLTPTVSRRIPAATATGIAG